MTVENLLDTIASRPAFDAIRYTGKKIAAGKSHMELRKVGLLDARPLIEELNEELNEELR